MDCNQNAVSSAALRDTLDSTVSCSTTKYRRRNKERSRGLGEEVKEDEENKKGVNMKKLKE